MNGSVGREEFAQGIEPVFPGLYVGAEAPTP